MHLFAVGLQLHLHTDFFAERLNPGVSVWQPYAPVPQISQSLAGPAEATFILNFGLSGTMRPMLLYPYSKETWLSWARTGLGMVL